MQAIPTIHFPGNCDEALNFYCKAIGAELLFRFKVSEVVVDPQAIRPGTGDKILRAGLRIGDSVIQFADGHGAGGPAFQGFSLTLSAASEDEAGRLVEALADGGKVQIPLRTTAWAETFGTVVDRFGLHWTIEAGRRFATV
jgi:PhnB protein